MKRPAARLVIDGRDVSTEMTGPNAVLISLEVTDEAGIKSDRVEIDIDNRESFKAPPKGAIIQVWLGYEPEPIYQGRFKVDQWTKRGPRRTLHVSGKSAELTTAIRASKARSWHQKTLGEITRKVSSDHGLTAVIDPELDTRVIEHIDQQHESDLAFLSRLAKRNGATFKLADGKVILSKKGSTKLPSGKGKPSIILTPDMVGEWTATSQDRGDYASVSAEYPDHKHGRRRKATTGSGKPEHRERMLYATSNEATRATRAGLHDLKRGQADFETQGEGMPDIFAEATVTAKNFDPDVDGEYRVRTVRHVYESRGFTTTVTMELAGSATDDETDEDTVSGS